MIKIGELVRVRDNAQEKWKFGYIHSDSISSPVVIVLIYDGALCTSLSSIFQRGCDIKFRPKTDSSSTLHSGHVTAIRNSLIHISTNSDTCRNGCLQCDVFPIFEIDGFWDIEKEMDCTYEGKKGILLGSYLASRWSEIQVVKLTRLLLISYDKKDIKERDNENRFVDTPDISVETVFKKFEETKANANTVDARKKEVANCSDILTHREVKHDDDSVRFSEKSLSAVRFKMEKHRLLGKELLERKEQQLEKSNHRFFRPKEKMSLLELEKSIRRLVRRQRFEVIEYPKKENKKKSSKHAFNNLTNPRTRQMRVMYSQQNPTERKSVKCKDGSRVYDKWWFGPNNIQEKDKKNVFMHSYDDLTYRVPSTRFGLWYSTDFNDIDLKITQQQQQHQQDSTYNTYTTTKDKTAEHWDVIEIEKISSSSDLIKNWTHPDIQITVLYMQLSRMKLSFYPNNDEQIREDLVQKIIKETKGLSSTEIFKLMVAKVPIDVKQPPHRIILCLCSWYYISVGSESIHTTCEVPNSVLKKIASAVYYGGISLVSNVVRDSTIMKKNEINLLQRICFESFDSRTRLKNHPSSVFIINSEKHNLSSDDTIEMNCFINIEKHKTNTEQINHTFCTTMSFKELISENEFKFLRRFWNHSNIITMRLHRSVQVYVAELLYKILCRKSDEKHDNIMEWIDMVSEKHSECQIINSDINKELKNYLELWDKQQLPTNSDQPSGSPMLCLLGRRIVEPNRVKKIKINKQQVRIPSTAWEGSSYERKSKLALRLNQEINNSPETSEINNQLNQLQATEVLRDSQIPLWKETRANMSNCILPIRHEFSRGGCQAYVRPPSPPPSYRINKYFV